MLLLSPLLRPILEPILNRILGVGNAVTYDWGPFRFGEDDATPVASPYTEAGAVGSMTITDPDGAISIAGGEVVWAGLVGAVNHGLVGLPLTRVAGRAFLVQATRHTNVSIRYGWSTSTTPSGAITYGLRTSGASAVDIRTTNTTIYNAVIGAAAHEYAIVLRGTGAWLLVRTPPGDGALTMLWVYDTDSTATLYTHQSAVPTDTLDERADLPRVTTLGGAWATDTGIATSYKATTTDADTATMTADALVYHTITAQTGVTQELRFRVTDADNYWLLRMAAPGINTIKVIEVVATVETERASTAQTFVNATQYRIGVLAAGAAITPFVDITAKTGYASAATGLTATGVYVSHAGAKLVCWPRTVSLPSGV